TTSGPSWSPSRRKWPSAMPHEGSSPNEGRYGSSKNATTRRTKSNAGTLAGASGRSIVAAQCIIAGHGGTECGRTGMSFMDLRQWMRVLDKEGELRRITAEVDWDREIGAIARRVLERKGPALLFENIKGYQRGPCTRLMTGGLGDSRRLALALGFPKDASNREMVQHAMKKNRELIAPVVVRTGPVKENVVRGADVDQTVFPLPKCNYPEPGSYIHTFSSIVTRDPETRVMNVGIYRGMIGRKDTCPMLLIKGGQHWGQHFVKYAARKEPMPVACVIGWDPILSFLAGSPIPTGV